MTNRKAGPGRPHFLGKLLTLDPQDLDLSGRGFHTGPETSRARPRLDEVVHAFAGGFNTALSHPPAEFDFAESPRHLRGFAVEGAAMSSTLLDLLTRSGGRRIRDLAEGPGRHHIHLVHVGAGWAFARLHLRPWRGIRFGHPLLRWLAWDGWGFHQAYFRSARVFAGRVERAARGDVRPIRDQGAGRALWFYAGADSERIADVIAAFPEERRGDLWAGVGLAAGYTGAQPPSALASLLYRAAGYHADLAQGAAFAAKAHAQSGAIPVPSAAAVEALTGVAAPAAADWTDAAFATAMSRGPDTPETYEMWRAGVRRAWARQGSGITP